MARLMSQDEEFTPNDVVRIELRKEGVSPVELSRVPTDEDGVFSATLHVPATVRPGLYQIAAEGEESATADVTVLEPAEGPVGIDPEPLGRRLRFQRPACEGGHWAGGINSRYSARCRRAALAQQDSPKSRGRLSPISNEIGEGQGNATAVRGRRWGGLTAVEDTVRSKVLRRLDFIEGHPEGVRRMVERDESCADVLRQTYAVRAAIQKVEAAVFANYLASDVLTAPRDKRWDRVTAELVYLYGLRRGRRVPLPPSPPSDEARPEHQTKGRRDGH